MEFWDCAIRDLDGGEFVGRVVCDETGTFHHLVGLPEGPDAWLPVLGSLRRYDEIVVVGEKGFLAKVVALFGLTTDEMLDATNAALEESGTVTARMCSHRRREIVGMTLDECIAHREDLMRRSEGEFLYAQMTGSDVRVVSN